MNSLTVLSQHDHDLRVGELPLHNGQTKVPHGFLHVRILVAAHLFHLLLICSLCYFENQ